MNKQEEKQLEKVRESSELVALVNIISFKLFKLVSEQKLRYDSGRMLKIYLLNADLKKSVDLLQTSLL